MYDVIVIGGGVIGLSRGGELAGRKSGMLLDRGSTGQGISRAAAGMLAPLSEADDLVIASGVWECGAPRLQD